MSLSRSGPDLSTAPAPYLIGATASAMWLQWDPSVVPKRGRLSDFGTSCSIVEGCSSESMCLDDIERGNTQTVNAEAASRGTLARYLSGATATAWWLQ